jgi:hypothetical protein
VHASSSTKSGSSGAASSSTARVGTIGEFGQDKRPTKFNQNVSIDTDINDFKDKLAQHSIEEERYKLISRKPPTSKKKKGSKKDQKKPSGFKLH